MASIPIPDEQIRVTPRFHLDNRKLRVLRVLVLAFFFQRTVFQCQMTAIHGTNTADKTIRLVPVRERL